MAGFSETLSVPMSGRDTARPDPKGPGIISSLASIINVGSEMVQGAAQTRSKAAAAARARQDQDWQAQDRSRQEGERAAGNAVADALLDVHANRTRPDSGEFEPGAYDAINATAQAGAEIGNLSVAARQGRAKMGDVEVRSEMALRRLFRDHPDHKAHIVAKAKEMGIVSPIIADYERAAKAVTEEEDAVRKRDQEDLDFGIQQLALPETMPRHEIINQARKAREAERNLEINAKRATTQATLANLSKQERDEAKADASDRTFQELINLQGPQLTAAVQAVKGLAFRTDIPDAEKEAGLTRAISALRTQGQLQIKNALAKYGATMTPERRSEFEKQGNDYLNMLVETVNGPLSDVQSSQRTMTLLTNDMKLDIAKALPLYTQMKEAFGSQVVNETFFQSMLTDPKLKTDIQRELNGFNGLRPTETRTRIQNMISIIKGEASLKDYTPAEARKMLGPLTESATNLAANPNVRTGKDVAGHRSGVLAVGAVANAAVDAVPQWGITPLHAVVTRLTDPRVVDMVYKKGVNDDVVNTVVGIHLPALQQVHDALKAAPSSDPLYTVKFQNGKYYWTPKPEAKGIIANEMRMTAAAPGRKGMVGPTEETKRKVEGLNKTLGVLSEASRNGWDDAVPKTLTEVERRMLYAQGVVPEKMRGKAGQAGKGVIESWQSQVDQVTNKAIENIGAIEFTPGDLPASASSAMSFFTKKGWTPVQAAGIVGNLQAESGADFSQRGTAGDGGKAIGVAQWHPDRQANFKKQMGKDVREASLEEQFAFVDWELNNTEGEAGRRLRAATSPEEAAEIIDQFYERSSGAHRDKRKRNARALMGD